MLLKLVLSHRTSVRFMTFWHHQQFPPFPSCLSKREGQTCREHSKMNFSLLRYSSTMPPPPSLRQWLVCNWTRWLMLSWQAIPKFFFYWGRLVSGHLNSKFFLLPYQCIFTQFNLNSKISYCSKWGHSRAV